MSSPEDDTPLSQPVLNRRTKRKADTGEGQASGSTKRRVSNNRSKTDAGGNATNTTPRRPGTRRSSAAVRSGTRALRSGRNSSRNSSRSMSEAERNQLRVLLEKAKMEKDLSSTLESSEPGARTDIATESTVAAITSPSTSGSASSAKASVNPSGPVLTEQASGRASTLNQDHLPSHVGDEEDEEDEESDDAEDYDGVQNERNDDDDDDDIIDVEESEDNIAGPTIGESDDEHEVQINLPPTDSVVVTPTQDAQDINARSGNGHSPEGSMGSNVHVPTQHGINNG